MKPFRASTSLGNRFIVGLSGTELNDLDKQLLSSLRPLGVLLLRRNFNHAAPYPEWLWQLERLLKSVREYTERELLMVTLDHEGERVTRTPAPITVFPNACFVKERAAAVAAAQALELRSMGVNVSWAPVTDIHSNAANPIIGQRAFGTSAADAATYASQYLVALEQAGIVGCAKHFPGHGDTTTDSHLELPRLDLSLEELRNRELVPFKALFAKGVSLCMTAHIRFPQIDSENTATLSRTILTTLLRQELGYQGVTISDDIDMLAVSDRFDAPDSLLQGIKAGCDMFIVSRNIAGKENRVVELAKALHNQCESGAIAAEELFASENRIETLIRSKLTHYEPYVLSAEILQKHQELARGISR